MVLYLGEKRRQLINKTLKQVLDDNENNLSDIASETVSQNCQDLITENVVDEVENATIRQEN